MLSRCSETTYWEFRTFVDFALLRLAFSERSMSSNARTKSSASFLHSSRVQPTDSSRAGETSIRMEVSSRAGAGPAFHGIFPEGSSSATRQQRMRFPPEDGETGGHRPVFFGRVCDGGTAVRYHRFVGKNANKHFILFDKAF